MCGLKPKRKNSEKRKAKSRDAARVRRSKESDIFRELTELLPLSEKIRTTLDKTVVTRLAICYIRLQELIKSELTRKRGGKELDKKLDALYLKAFNGFMVIVGADGFVTYLSENVSLFLGLTQIDVMAQSIYEFTHASNHEQLREMLLSGGGGSEETKTCCLLFKCTLTSKGHNVSVKLAGHKVMDCSCIRLAHSNSIMMLCRPLLDPINIDQPLGSHVFVTKHSLDMKFVYADKKMQELLGYDDLVGQSLYTYAYGTDCALLRKAYSNIVTKGQTVTELYRMLTARGGYLWLQTQATVVVDPWTQKPECVVCVNSAVGGIEQSDIVLGEVQMASMYTPPLTPEEFVLETNEIFDPSVEPLLVGEDDLNDVLFPEIAPLTNKNAVAANNAPPLFGGQVIAENSDQELDVSLFAPYIPMDSADDTLFPQMDDLDILNFVQMPENAMLGKTESVFGQMPDETLEEDRKSTKQNRMPLGDARRQNVGPHRVKQSVETNCASLRLPSVTLRPAAAAGARMAGATSVGHDHGHIALPADSLNFGGAGFVRRPEVRFASSSANGGSAVLRNLLLKGADIPSGYSIRNSNHQQGSADRVGVMRYGSSQWSGARVG